MDLVRTGDADDQADGDSEDLRFRDYRDLKTTYLFGVPFRCTEDLQWRLQVGLLINDLLGDVIFPSEGTPVLEDLHIETSRMSVFKTFSRPYPLRVQVPN